MAALKRATEHTRRYILENRSASAAGLTDGEVAELARRTRGLAEEVAKAEAVWPGGRGLRRPGMTALVDAGVVLADARRVLREADVPRPRPADDVLAQADADAEVDAQVDAAALMRPVMLLAPTTTPPACGAFPIPLKRRGRRVLGRCEVCGGDGGGDLGETGIRGAVEVMCGPCHDRASDDAEDKRAASVEAKDMAYDEERNVLLRALAAMSAAKVHAEKRAEQLQEQREAEEEAHDAHAAALRRSIDRLTATLDSVTGQRDRLLLAPSPETAAEIHRELTQN